MFKTSSKALFIPITLAHHQNKPAGHNFNSCLLLSLHALYQAPNKRLSSCESSTMTVPTSKYMSENYICHFYPIAVNLNHSVS